MMVGVLYYTCQGAAARARGREGTRDRCKQARGVLHEAVRGGWVILAWRGLDR